MKTGRWAFITSPALVLATVALLSAAQVAAASGGAEVCEGTRVLHRNVPRPSVHGVKLHGDTPQVGAGLEGSTRTLAVIKVWKVCSALRFEASCARYV
jgi:hypothetical protein